MPGALVSLAGLRQPVGLFVQGPGPRAVPAALRQLGHASQDLDPGRLPPQGEVAGKQAALRATFEQIEARSALMLADVAVGILARVAPQFNLFAVQMPVKMMLGLLALSLALPVMVPRLAAMFRTVPAMMTALAG